MSTFKIIAGDFGTDVRGQVLVGKLCRESSQGFHLPMPGRFSTTHVGLEEIDSLEIATEENLKKMGGAIGWGLAGGIALGPIGALAGVLAGARKTEITFICQFKDGRRFLGRCGAKAFSDLQAARFSSSNVSRSKNLNAPAIPRGDKHSRARLAFVTAALLIVFGLIIFAINTASPKKSAEAPTQQLNQPAANLVSALLVSDVQAVALNNQHAVTATRVEDLLGWANLNWQTTAKQYDADYDANEVSADGDFKGKSILISGTIDSIEKDVTDSAFLMLRTPGLGVRAEFASSAAAAAAFLRKGQQVNLVCKGSGRVVSIATLDGCTQFDSYLQQMAPTVSERVKDFLSGKGTLTRKAAVPVVTTYVVALSLPSGSECWNSSGDQCRKEIAALYKDASKKQKIDAAASQLLTTLQVN